VNALHGSANAIGGLNVVLKMRWGKDADGLVMKEAKPGIKFALGENPKRQGQGGAEPVRRQPCATLSGHPYGRGRCDPRGVHRGEAIPGRRGRITRLAERRVRACCPHAGI